MTHSRSSRMSILNEISPVAVKLIFKLLLLSPTESAKWGQSRSEFEFEFSSPTVSEALQKRTQSIAIHLSHEATKFAIPYS